VRFDFKIEIGGAQDEVDRLQIALFRSIDRPASGSCIIDRHGTLKEYPTDDGAPLDVRTIGRSVNGTRHEDGVWHYPC
jgi:hypothetical protein